MKCDKLADRDRDLQVAPVRERGLKFPPVKAYILLIESLP